MIRATSLCAEAERVTQSIESDAPPNHLEAESQDVWNGIGEINFGGGWNQATGTTHSAQSSRWGSPWDTNCWWQSHFADRQLSQPTTLGSITSTVSLPRLKRSSLATA